MEQVDAAFVVRLFAGHIVRADLVVDRSAGTPHGRGDVITGLQVADVRANFFDDAERFVTEDQVFEAGRRIAV